VTDYFLALKLNDFKAIWRLMHYMLPAIASLELSPPATRNQYTRCMLPNLRLLHWHKAQNTLTWRMFRQDPGLFNEDVGETALSILAQHTARMRLTELHQVDKLFQEISLMTAAVDQFSHFKSSNDTQSSSFLIDLASQDISQTVSFLNRLVTTLKLGVGKTVRGLYVRREGCGCSLSQGGGSCSVLLV
jgi:hypothetical protein